MSVMLDGVQAECKQCQAVSSSLNAVIRDTKRIASREILSFDCNTLQASEDTRQKQGLRATALVHGMVQAETIPTMGLTMH